MATTPDTQHSRAPLSSGNPAPSTRQLDFYQAMHDFKHMFPNMDEDVIEAVLRANSGAVDSTIDQLLTMNMDNEDHDVYPPRKSTTSRLHDSQREAITSMGAPPSYSSTMQNSNPSPKRNESVDNHSTTPPLGYSPPSSKNAGVWLEPHADYAPKSSLKSSPEKGSHGRTLAKSESLPMTDSPNDALPTLPATRSPKSVAKSQAAKRLYRHWNPPMLGTLPDDFLRISVSPARNRNPVNRSHSLPVHRRNGRDGHRDRHHQRSRTLMTGPGELSCQMLQQKIVENEIKRCSITPEMDPEQAQFLEDERAALMLQNLEFLQTLRKNEDFMRTLERDRMNATAFDPQPPTSPVPPALSEGISPGTDQIEGYGQDRQDTLDTFPFGQEMPKDEDAEFRKQLGQMGGTSRKKFQALARKFFKSKKKKVPTATLR